MSDFQFLRMNKSPFHKNSHYGKYVRGNPNEKIDVRIPKTAYNDLMAYFKGMGMTKTEGFNQIVWDKLAMINTSKRTIFNQVEAIVIVPRTKDLKKLNEKSRIIALYNTDEDFIDEYNHQDGFDKSFNYQYDLMPLAEDFFPMMTINSTKESQVYRVNHADLTNWDSLYSRLDELYGLDGEEWDFVRFPLNNYLDVKQDGQFQSPQYRGTHEGIYIFDDFNRKRLFCRLTWDYSFETKSIGFDIRFIPMFDFMEILEKSDFKPLNESYASLKNSDYDKKKLEEMIETTEKTLEFLKKSYAKR